MIAANNQPLDWDFDFLESVLEILDGKLMELTSQIDACSNPDASLDYERVEMVCGMGFVACQRYLASFAARNGLTKAEALAYGERVASGITVSEAVNAAANFWKRGGEWDGRKEDRQIRRTKADIEGFGRIGQDYVLSCVLAELAGPKCRFADLLPKLKAWREDLLDRRISAPAVSHCHCSPVSHRP